MPAIASFKAILLQWKNPSDKDLAAVEVWSATVNDRATAILVGAPNGVPGLPQEWAHTGLGSSETRYYWLRPRDRSGNVGAFSPTNPLAGVSATTTLIESDDLSATAEGTTRRLLEEIYVELLGIRDAMLEARS